MAWSENASMARQTQFASLDPDMSAYELQQRLEEFGSRLRELKEQEPEGPSREWLEEAERRHRLLRAALEDYRRERAEQRANESAWETGKRNVQSSYDTLKDYTKTAAHNVAEGFRKSWEGVTNAFNDAFGRDQKQEGRDR
jgi:hypothetical protein